MNNFGPWFLYMLLCDEKIFYVGITNNLIKRIREHENKKSFFTKQFSHLNLVYSEKYKTKYEAAKREQQIKGWSHSKKQRLLTGELGINTCTEYAEVLLANGRNL